MGKRTGLDKPEWQEAIKLARSIGPQTLSFKDGTVCFGDAGSSSFSGSKKEEIRQAISSFYPWRKGPFEILGTRVEASWKSDLKWDRVLKLLEETGRNLAEGHIADIGANNGYYMFRMLEHRPLSIVGMDPVGVMNAQFEFLRSLHPHPSLNYARAGFDYLGNYHNYFDFIFNMGILYHHTDPMEILRYCFEAMKSGGLLILETMGVESPLHHDSKFPFCLFPGGKYAGANGVWFLPDPEATVAMLSRAGFTNIRIHEVHSYVEEQQKSDYSRMPELSAFLDPNDPGKTVEGYPAPVRILVSAEK